MPDYYLKQALLCLCNPRIHILDKEVKVPKFDDPNEKFKVNLEFSSQNVRVNLLPNQQSKSAKDTDRTQSNIQFVNEIKVDREIVIQATIVKILKTHKTVAHK